MPANPPTVIVDGNDPGITSDAFVSYAQIELVAATAPSAKVNFYTAASTQLDTGIAFASIRALEDNTAQVLVFGFEGCEADLGLTNGLFSALWEQAAAQGISVVAGSGSGGSAECDAVPGSGTPESKASRGLAVNGYASTPYATAVGTTDFYYGPFGTLNPNDLNSFSQYWNKTNGGTAGYTSAKGYIPEQPNNSSLQSTNQVQFTPEVFATGGGSSTLGFTKDDGTQTFYVRPQYQLAAAKAIPGTARVVPDVSIFGGFNNGSVYITCLTASDCVGGSAQGNTLVYSAAQGTGLATAAFGGIAALVVQAKGPQGNLNPALYATQAAAPAAFHDITAGTNTVQCSGGPNCVNGYIRTVAGGALAYKATAGYDAASGLGSVNVANLISNWTTPTGVATIALAIAPGTFHHGDAAQLTVSVAGAGGTPTGDVAITTSSPQNRTLETLTLVNGTATDSQIGALLPAGVKYQVTARYGGDSKFAPAIASTTITVYQIQSALVVLTTDPLNQPLPAYTGQTLSYGSTVQFSFQVYSSTDKNDRGTPSGAITVYDNGNKVRTVLLNSEGYATFSSSTLAPGSHTFSATYGGDSTYSNTSLTGAFPKVVIGGAKTQTVLTATDANLASRNSTFQLLATVTPTAAPQCGAPSCVASGTAPSGTVRFTAGGSLLGTATLNLGMNTGLNPSSTAAFTVARQTLPAGTTSIVATYVPNTGNYTGSLSAPLSIAVGAGNGFINTNIKLAAVPAGAVNFDNSGTVGFTATVSVAAGNAVATGNVNFFANGALIGAAALDGTGVAPFTVPDATQLPLGQSSITAQYVGDSTHASSATSYTVNVYDGTSTPDFSMQSDPQYQNISASNTTANFSLQFTSLNGLAALGTPIALSYTTPPGFTCSGAPTAPNFNGGTSATVTVTCGPAVGSTVAVLSKPNSPILWMAEGGAALACIFLFGMPARRRSWQSLIGSLALIVVAFGVTGCGAVNGVSGKDSSGGLLDGKSATPAVRITPGTYNVIVTGTARVFVKSQPNTTVTVVHNLPLKIIVS